MSKAKWLVVRKSGTGEIIATSTNQIVPPKMLYNIHQTSLSSWSVEGGLETRLPTGLLYLSLHKAHNEMVMIISLLAKTSLR